jgi:hypothetical protein
MSIRRHPRVGDAVTIVYLATEVAGVVEEVERGGQSVVVCSSDGERLTFALNRAIGRFTEGGQLTAARLRFVEGESR